MLADVSKLISLMQRVLSGEEITHAEVYDAAWQAEGELARSAKEAWFELQHWTRDRDVREKDPGYGNQKKERLRWLLGELERG